MTGQGLDWRGTGAGAPATRPAVRGLSLSGATSRRTFQRRAVGVPVVDAELVHRRQGRVHDWAFDVVRSEGVAVLGFTEHAGDRLELGNVDEMVELEEEHAELMDGV